MLSIRQTPDYRLPLSVIASILVLINISLIGADIYLHSMPDPVITSNDTRNTGGHYTAKSDNSNTKQPSPATTPHEADSNTSSSVQQPDNQRAPDNIQMPNQTQAQPPAADTSTSDTLSTQPQPTPGRGGGGPATTSSPDVIIASPSEEPTVTVSPTPLPAADAMPTSGNSTDEKLIPKTPNMPANPATNLLKGALPIQIN